MKMDEPRRRVLIPESRKARSRIEQAPRRRYEDFRHFLEAAVERGGDRLAFRWRPEGSNSETRLSYRELGRAADAVGRALLGLGLARGAPVALVSENRPEWCVAYLGIVAAGLVAVPLDPGLDEAGLVRTIQASGARALFASDKILRRAPALRQEPLAMLAGFDCAPEQEKSLGLRSWAALVKEEYSSRNAALPQPGEIGPCARAVMFFTSGTTGIAKGISLSHGAVIANVDASRAALKVDERDVFVALLPLHHTYATTCSFLSSVEASCTCVVVDRLAPSAVLRALREGQVSFLIGVPLLFDKVKGGILAEIDKKPRVLARLLRGMLAASKFLALRCGLPAGRFALSFLREKAGLGSVRLAVSGGGPLSPDTADFYDALGIEMVQGYGMSENGPLISVNLPGLKNNRSVGFPVRDTEVRLEDPDLEGIGEIQVRSPSLMEGYLGNPEATAEAFTEDGWLRTGDLGKADARGFLYITGRRKNLIVTEGGKNIYPEEIEARFEGSPWIKEVLILGRRRKAKKAGEEVFAVFVPDYDHIEALHPGRSTDEGAVKALVTEDLQRIDRHLPAYMKIAAFAIRKEPFEKTSSQKIKRFLYKEYAESSSPLGSRG